MASASAGDVGRHLRQLFGAGSGVGPSDGPLRSGSPRRAATRPRPRFSACRRRQPGEPADGRTPCRRSALGLGLLGSCLSVAANLVVLYPARARMRHFPLLRVMLDPRSRR